MSREKPKKISLTEIRKSATLFFIDTELEEEYDKKVKNFAYELHSDLKEIQSKDGMIRYIKTNNNALKHIIAVLNVSEEKFKRIITMLRIEKGHAVTNEWQLNAIQKQMVEKEDFMSEICDLLIQGSKMEKYKAIIPLYYLGNFNIDHTTIARLDSLDDLIRMGKKSYEGQYNNKIGDSFYKYVSKYIVDESKSRGLTVTEKEKIPFCNKSIDLMIQDDSHPRILINIAYGITTSSSQTRTAEALGEIREAIREKNAVLEEDKQIYLIQIVDGAGWIARNSDLQKLERATDYILNLKTLSQITEILDYHL